jgi:hypothetical protein
MLTQNVPPPKPHRVAPKHWWEATAAEIARERGEPVLEEEPPKALQQTRAFYPEYDNASTGPAHTRRRRDW